MAANEITLTEEIKSHPDTNLFFYPERALASDATYVFNYPLSADFRIGLLIDPCRHNVYNCCMNVFGTPEYPALLKSNLEQDRVYKYVVIADETDVSSNYYLVYEDGSAIASNAQRSADDFRVHNKTCVAMDVPYSYCQGRNYATQRTYLRPACMDNNSTLDVLAGCQTITGESLPHCVQIGYSSNTFIPLCKEIQTQITERNVTGYHTTTLPLTWMGNTTKSTAPYCCCPQVYQSITRVGWFQCPVGASGSGALGKVSTKVTDLLRVDSLMSAYPYCHNDLSSSRDMMMCSVYAEPDQRHYTRECLNLTQSVVEPNLVTSVDMFGGYPSVCPYYPSCGTTLDSGKCRGSDLRFTFIGRVGIVTSLDNEAEIPTVSVTFNNWRTSYTFYQSDVKLETTSKSMYEIWWVVRSKVARTVMKRKGFNITNPLCTFDTTNNRYFPYAILKDGVALVTSDVA
eukprot:gene29738-36833_t